MADLAEATEALVMAIPIEVIVETTLQIQAMEANLTVMTVEDAAVAMKAVGISEKENLLQIINNEKWS